MIFTKWDQAVKSDPPFEYVIHTASPFYFNVEDPIKDLIDPAVKGTTGILKAVKAFAPTVKRIILTSSFAAIVNPGNHPKVYNESVWNPVTLEDAMDPSKTYRASKVKLSLLHGPTVSRTLTRPEIGCANLKIRPWQRELPGHS